MADERAPELPEPSSTAGAGYSQVAMSPAAVVIRFRPTDPARVLTLAEREFRRVGHYGLSVFADAAKDDETEHDVHLRLLKASERAYVTAEANPKYYVCAPASGLLDRGFTFWKDDDDDEVHDHYCVNLGQLPGLETINQFLEPFHVEARPK